LFPTNKMHFPKEKLSAAAHYVNLIDFSKLATVQMRLYVVDCLLISIKSQLLFLF